MRQILFVIVLAGLLGLLAGPVPAQERPPLAYGYTYHQADGNRMVMGRGTFPAVRVVDVSLSATPAWLAGLTGPDGLTRWQVQDREGIAQQIVLHEGQVRRIPPASDAQPASALPVLVASASASGNLRSRAAPTRFTHPIPVQGGRILQVLGDGAVVMWQGEQEVARLPLDALPDARPMVSADGRIALYVSATRERYIHGVLGDDLEGAALAILVPTAEGLQIEHLVTLSGERVFEGLAPFWADVDGDGTDDLVTTVSDSADGARIRVYLRSAQRDDLVTIESEPIGRGGRWRHTLAWGAFGPQGDPLLVSVLTPHIGGVVQWHGYNPQTQALELVASLPGYTSHLIGSRNMDMAVAGDFDGDGQIEIVVPSQDRRTLAGLVLKPEGPVVAWSVPVGGEILTNLAAVPLPDGRLALAAGRADGVLRVWLPADEE